MELFSKHTNRKLEYLKLRHVQMFAFGHVDIKCKTFTYNIQPSLINQVLYLLTLSYLFITN